MGDYTGLRCKVVIKPEYRHIIDELTHEVSSWSELNTEYSFIKEFSNCDRANSIPNGPLAYMPEEWKDDREFAECFYMETGIWVFQCALKNYEKTIQKFFELILENIASEIIDLEYYYEYWSSSQRYDFVDGKVTLVNNKYKKYGYEDDDSWRGYGALWKE